MSRLLNVRGLENDGLLFFPPCVRSSEASFDVRARYLERARNVTVSCRTHKTYGSCTEWGLFLSQGGKYLPCHSSHLSCHMKRRKREPLPDEHETEYISYWDMGEREVFTLSNGPSTMATVSHRYTLYTGFCVFNSCILVFSQISRRYMY